MTPRSCRYGLALAVLLSLRLSAPLPAEEKKEPPKRVLVFTATGTREYQFLLRHLLSEEKAGRIELSLCLQSLSGKGDQQSDVPPARFLDAFPETLRAAEEGDKKALYATLASYDLVIALDPDWTKLTPKQSSVLSSGSRPAADSSSSPA
jgi:hypothetical protein